MKNRSRKAVLNAKRKPNPLRQDPTRSVTMRRAFAGKVGLMFMRLKGTILKQLIDGDALGLRPVRREVFNAFCPTGEGGGVDPSCSPGETGGGGGGSAREHYEKAKELKGKLDSKLEQMHQFDNEATSSIHGELRGSHPATERLREALVATSSRSPRATQRAWKKISEAAHEAIKADVPGEVKQAARKAIVAAKKYDQHVLEHDVIHADLRREVFKLRDAKGSTNNAEYDLLMYEILINAFCPTGEGGGVDPSCSPGETGGGGGGASGDKKASGIVARFKSLPSAVAGKIKAKVVEKYSSLEARYGSKYAKAIIGAALVGLPVPLPGASMALAAPVVAVAELHRMVSARKGARTATANAEVEEMTDEEVKAAAEELVASLKEEFGDLVGDTEEGEPDDLSENSGPTVNPFVSEAQRQACYAADDPDWDCKEWEEHTPDKKLPKTKRTDNCAAGQMRDATTGRCGPGIGVDIPRAEMPQIRGDDFEEFLRYADRKGVKVEDDMVPVTDLSPTQREFRQERVDDIPHAKALFEPIIVSQDGYVLDGTHRWVKVWQRNKSAKMRVARIDLPIYEALALMREFPRVKFAANADDWRFRSDPKKVEAFKKWLEQQISAVLAGRTQQQLWDRYIQDGFKKGQGRAFDDANRSEEVIARGQEKLDFYAGTRDEFLRSSFGRPVAREKVQLLAGRTFDELRGITADMSLRMTRKLTDGLVQGKSPREVARDLNAEVDIGWTRALTVARTELIRAHAEGQLTALEDLGVEDVGVAVEWSTTGDDRVCEECQPLEGVVMKLDEARGMLPRHPNCRCAWIPANVGEDRRGQKATRGSITGAVRDSRKAGGDEDDESWGPAKEVDKSRPRSIFNELDRRMAAALNAFCPTGEGGGVDPTCSPGISTGAKVEWGGGAGTWVQVFIKDGKKYIHDGHHTAAGAKLAGRTEVRARVVSNLSKEEESGVID